MNNTQPVLWEEPRFTPTGSPKSRAQTLATSSLLRESIDMHNLRNTRVHSEGTEVPLDFAAYIEHSRAALESQRASFERERKAFAQERKLWDTERCILRSQIAELEAAVGKKDGGGWSGFARASQGRGSAYPPLFTGKALPSGNTDRLNGETNGRHVWEGPIPKPTRVFPDESKGDINHEIHGNGCDKWELPDGLRGRSDTITQYPRIGEPTGGIDGTLDGIVFKSSRSPPDPANRAISESPESPLGSSIQKSSPDRRSSGKMTLSNIGPPEENLTKDAGHTPMAVIGSGVDTQTQSTNSPDDTSKEEDAPLTPQTTLHRPSGETNSYFPEPDEDPELTGPLGLKNEEIADNAFLHELDERLLDEAKKIVSGPSSSKNDDTEADDWTSDMDEPEPELRFKKTSNFGAPFGSTLVR